MGRWRIRRWWPPVRGVRGGGGIPRELPGGTDKADVARVVAVADGQSDVIERRQRVAVFGLKLRQAIARCDSSKRLPLSWAITRPRRRASSAGTGSASRKAQPWAQSANE